MEKLFFPEKKKIESKLKANLEKEGNSLLDKMYDIEKRAEDIEQMLRQPQQSVNESEVESLAMAAYALTIQLIDYKKSMGEELIEEEEEIYEFCKKETAVEKKHEDSAEIKSVELKDGTIVSTLNTIWSIFNALEYIRTYIDQTVDWLGFSSKEDEANLLLINEGKMIVKNYAEWVSVFLIPKEEMFGFSMLQSVMDIAKAQMKCALSFQRNVQINSPEEKKLAKDMLYFADFAYEGYIASKYAGEDIPNDFQLLAKNDLPIELRSIYDENTGLLSGTRGLKVWLGTWNGAVIVSYSGTDIRDPNMIYADILQLFSPSVLYIKAAGLLKILLEKLDADKFYVTGHSLGGGLTQFALTANIMKNKEIIGYGFNPAGLSNVAITSLGDFNLSAAAQKMWIFTTCYDPVSLVGGKIGCLTTLPKSNKNGHGIESLKLCMNEYNKNNNKLKDDLLQDKKITWKANKDNNDIPYTGKLFFEYEDNATAYRVFSDGASDTNIDLISFEIPNLLFDHLDIQPDKCLSCMGVYNKLNGTDYTVMNRMLLLDPSGPIILDDSEESVYSSMIYGKFGIGIKEFIDKLVPAYVESEVLFKRPQSIYQEMLSNLNDLMQYDKPAWKKGFKDFFGVDTDSLFDQHPESEHDFDIFLEKVILDRIALYYNILSDNEPNDDMISEFLTGYNSIVSENIEEFFNKCKKQDVFTDDEVNTYMDNVKSFIQSITD